MIKQTQQHNTKCSGLAPTLKLMWLKLWDKLTLAVKSVMTQCRGHARYTNYPDGRSPHQVLQDNKLYGFTLVETLVAITILLVIIIGPLSISSSTARSTSFSGEQVVAFFLAQEGLEIVQKVRDDTLLEQYPNTNGWDNFVDESDGPVEECFTNSGCGLELDDDSDASLKTSVVCSGNNCDLYYDESDVRSKYTHTATGNEDTVFSREIELTSTGNNEVHIVSRVYWRTGDQAAAQEVEVESYLYDIYGN